MSRFRLDIEQHRKTLRDKGLGELRSLVCLQYPIYCVHASVIDSTPDPTDKIDKAILQLIEAEANIDIKAISTLLGFAKPMVAERINKLKVDGFLKLETTLITTEYGLEFVRNGTEKKLKNRDVDIYVDGITLRAFSREFSRLFREHFFNEHGYFHTTDINGEPTVHRSFAPDLVHTPVNTNHLVDEIKSYSREQRIESGIPEGLEDIKSLSFTMLTLPVLISMSDNGAAVKTVVNGFSAIGEVTHITPIVEMLEPKVGNLLIQLREHKGSPQIGNNWPEIDKSDYGVDRIFSLSKKDFIEALEHNYGFSSKDTELYSCEGLQLSVRITREMLKKARDKPRLIQNVIRGRDYIYCSPFSTGVWYLFVTFLPYDDYVKELCQILDIVNASEKRNLINNLKNAATQFSVGLRELLVEAGLQNIQEQIDIEEYMCEAKPSIV